MKEITSILGRATTGISIKPFIGATPEGEEFFFKPSRSLANSLIAEWIGAGLAKAMGLPIPDFEIVSVPKPLAEQTLGEQYQGLSHGPAFGSHRLASDWLDLRQTEVKRLQPDLLADLFFFDFWIQNADRLIGPDGGNPNLMFQPESGLLKVIDHDNAFDPKFLVEEILPLHPGSPHRHLFQNPERQRSWLDLARVAIDVALPLSWSQLPPDWLEDSMGDPRTNLSLLLLQETLEAPFQDPTLFWTPAFS